MYSSAVLLHFESAEAFEELRQRYYLKFAPASQPESDLGSPQKQLFAEGRT